MTNTGTNTGTGTVTGGVNTNCTLIVPQNPLTAQGLATPYQLTATNANLGVCDQRNPRQAAYVQAGILDLDTGRVFQYQPAVVNAGDNPAIAPSIPQLPTNSVVALWFGFQGQTLTLLGAATDTLAANSCINGLANSSFGSFAYCNAPVFFNYAHTAISRGNLYVAPIGTGTDGQACPTVRDYALQDHRYGDLVSTDYLVTTAGKLMQDTAANRNIFGGAYTVQTGAKAGVDLAVQNALGCTATGVADLGDNGALKPALFMDELQAGTATTNQALVPSNSPETLVNGQPAADKTTYFRLGLDEPALTAVGNDQTAFCTDFRSIILQRMAIDQGLFANQTSVSAKANNLYTYLAARANNTWKVMNCPNLANGTAPFAIAIDGNGTAVSAQLAGGVGVQSANGYVVGAVPDNMFPT